MSNAPKCMYWDGLRLQGIAGEYAAFTWQPLHDSSVRYIRADCIADLEAEVTRLRAEKAALVEALEKIKAKAFNTTEQPAERRCGWVGAAAHMALAAAQEEGSDDYTK